MSMLGEKVRELRQALGLSQAKLAAKGDFSVALIQRIESSRGVYVTATQIAELARGLDVPEEVLRATIPETSWGSHYPYIKLVQYGEEKDAATPRPGLVAL